MISNSIKVDRYCLNSSNWHCTFGKVGPMLHLHLWFTRRPSHLTIIARGGGGGGGGASFKRK